MCRAALLKMEFLRDGDEVALMPQLHRGIVAMARVNTYRNKYLSVRWMIRSRSRGVRVKSIRCPGLICCGGMRPGLSRMILS